jgi:hypothetical protein
MGNYPGSFGTSTPPVVAPDVVIVESISATELNLRTRELNRLSKKGYALISTVVIADGTTIIDTLQLRK